MTQDLFVTPKTKQELLLDWMKQKRYFSSVDITRYGLNNMYLRAPRTARNFRERGIIKRISDDEAIFRGLVRKGNKHIAWYTV